MKQSINEEIRKLETNFSGKDKVNSWYYKVLKDVINPKEAPKTSSAQKCVKDIDTDKMKQELIICANTLNNNDLVSKLAYFINTNSRNAYYFNITKAIISILKKVEDNLSVEEAKKITYKNNSHLSGFEKSIIDSLLPHFYNEEHTQTKLQK